MLPNINYKYSYVKLRKDRKEEVDAVTLPSRSMDGKTATKYNIGVKNRFRYVRADRNLVCKYWLRGVCKRGDQCDFSHQFDAKRIPECYYYSRFNACHNKECHFLHIDRESKIKSCYWYDKGFCPDGPRCRYRHVRRVLCKNYMEGFCPLEGNCKDVHLQFDLPNRADLSKESLPKERPTFHVGSEFGHEVAGCTNYSPSNSEPAAKRSALNELCQNYSDSTNSIQLINQRSDTQENMSVDSGNGESSDTSSD